MKPKVERIASLWGVFALLLLVFIVPLVGQVQAVDRYWIGPDGGYWDNNANWSPSYMPQDGEDVYLTQTNSTNKTVLYQNPFGQSQTFGTLTIDSTYTDNAYKDSIITLFQTKDTLKATKAYIGHSGNGTYEQSDGLNYVSIAGSSNTAYLYLGYNSGSTGTYNLSGGQLSVGEVLDNYNGYEVIGNYGTGTFKHTGGSHWVYGSLVLGQWAGSKGTYNLSGTESSALIARNEVIGSYGTGIFNQLGGKNNISDTLNLGGWAGKGTYNLSGGNLSAKNESVRSGSLFTQTGGENVMTGLYIQGSSALPGIYDLSNGILKAKDESVGYLGTGTFTQSGGENRVENRIYLGDYGTGTYTLSGTGYLSAQEQYIGFGKDEGKGYFTQTGGTNWNGNSLYLGYHTGTNGTYDLRGGLLTTNYEYIGLSGTGTFTQSGGDHTVWQELALGGNTTGATGTYNLSGADSSLHAGYLVIQNGSAFTQTGGTNTILYNISIGDLGASTYNLKDGSLSAKNERIGTSSSTSTFTQTGGANTVTNALYLGPNSGRGTYNLSDGSLSADNLYVGWRSGTGTFTQSGGTNAVTNYLSIAESSDSYPGTRGTYNLQGGTLTAGTIANNDKFNYTGGSLNANIQNNLSGTFVIQPTTPGSNLLVNGNIVNFGAIDIRGTTPRSTFTVNGNVNNGNSFWVAQTNAVFNGTFTNNGAYISDNATNRFSGLTIGTYGFIQGEALDKFYVENNLINQSTQNALWNTNQALLGFTGNNTHQFYLAGADLGANMTGFTNNFSWGTLNVEGILNLSDGNATAGGAQYVERLIGAILLGNMVTNIHGENGLNIYYLASAQGNEYLNGLTFNFTDGGQLIPIGNPVPLPPAVWLLGTGLLGLFGIRKRMKV